MRLPFTRSRPSDPTTDDLGLPAGLMACPDFAEHCCGCVSAPATVFLSCSTPGVVDLHLCAHHANEHEDALERGRWMLVRDRRQKLISAERRP